MKLEKIIHIMLDVKFNDMAIRQFEEAIAGIHEYWIVASELRLTKSSLARTCNHSTLASQLSRADVKGIIFHSLPPGHYGFLRHIPDGKCVVWLGWGYDYYSLLNHENEESRILPKTLELQTSSLHVQVKRKLRRLVKKMLIWGRWGAAQLPGTQSDLARVNYFSPVLDIEYEMVRRHLTIPAKYILWNYGTAEDDFSQPGIGFTSGVNILAGNSASATNNHIELFDLIRDQVDLTGRKVVAPLSYGDPHYRDQVTDYGIKTLGEAFMPLTDFMPVEQYLETIRSCGFVMMNHLRQQALGNVCMAMLMGAKVYLNSGNPLGSWLATRGAVFGNIENLDLKPLTEEQKVINKNFVFSHWGREHQYKKTKILIDTIINESARCA